MLQKANVAWGSPYKPMQGHDVLDALDGGSNSNTYCIVGPRRIVVQASVHGHQY